MESSRKILRELCLFICESKLSLHAEYRCSDGDSGSGDDINGEHNGDNYGDNYDEMVMMMRGGFGGGGNVAVVMVMSFTSADSGSGEDGNGWW